MSFGPWEEIATLARLAPTPHNTQPFRIRPLSARVAQIVALRERMLPVEDTDNLYVLSSFGIFAETLERAARHFGVHLSVTPDADVAPAAIGPGVGPVVLGRAEVLGHCLPQDERTALESRRTSRLPYEDRLVAPHILGELGRIAVAYGHRFESFDEPEVVRDVLQRNVTALLENNLKPEGLAELRSWIRIADTPDIGDGLWCGPLNQPRWEMRTALMAPRLFLLPGIASIVRRWYLRTQAGTRHVAILRGPFGSWSELVTAGRMLMDLWLAMTRHGLYMLPYGSMITNASCNRYLRERFAADDIWFILRFGYSKVPPKAPRLASVLMGDDRLPVGSHEAVRRPAHYVPGRSAEASP
jgi:nitroreductase